jgi:hypothetical protein
MTGYMTGYPACYFQPLYKFHWIRHSFVLKKQFWLFASKLDSKCVNEYFFSSPVLAFIQYCVFRRAIMDTDWDT